MNRVCLSGHLGDKPEMSYSNNGDMITKFRMATRGGRDRDGKDKVDWHQIMVFSKSRAAPRPGEAPLSKTQAELCAEMLDKGSFVSVDGKLKYNEFEEDGKKRKTSYVIADFVTFGNLVSANAVSRAREEASARNGANEKPQAAPLAPSPQPPQKGPSAAGYVPPPGSNGGAGNPASQEGESRPAADPNDAAWPF